MNDNALQKYSNPPRFPDPQSFFIEVPLYREYDLRLCLADDVYRLEYFSETIDAYCLECKKHSIFEGRRGYYLSKSKYKEVYLDDREFEADVNCTRNEKHSMVFYFMVRNGKISKVGQYPSLADLHEQDIQKYRKFLGPKYFEFARAIGLYAHGIGIGSFVYLRRIFEDQIEKAHERAQQDSNWDETTFQGKRVHEKIALLGRFLPEVMVKNANIYSILSKGVHELTEDECLEYFTTIKSGVELILDEEIAQKEREKKIKDITDEIARITGEIR